MQNKDKKKAEKAVPDIPCDENDNTVLGLFDEEEIV